MEYSERRIVNINQSALMRQAREALSDKWSVAVPAFLIAFVVFTVAAIIPIAPILIAGPFMLGLAMFSLKLSRNSFAKLENVFDGFQNFGNALVIYLLVFICVLAGFVLFIIPGIIAALGLSMTFYILAENPDIDLVEALKESWAMMNGYKMDFFLLGFYFIPWVILCVLTFGIGFFWLVPFYQVTVAKFYNTLKYGRHDGGPNPNKLEDELDHLVDDLKM